MFGIGGFELFLIILFGFLIFGPDKLPEIAKTVGMAINKFKKAKDEMDGVIREEIFDPSADEPFKNPSKALDRAHSAAKQKIKRAENEETFAQRKARYDRERAECKARAEIDQKKQAEIDANRAKMKQEAAAKAEAQGQAQTQAPVNDGAKAGTEAQVQGHADAEISAETSAATPASKPEPKTSTQRPTADQLYGNVPLNKDVIREKGSSESKSEAVSVTKPAEDQSASTTSKGGEQ
ncbi:twin-arginine translocase TatA/TatE family subunit [Anaerotardibacter muris]|uniref:twin-arginine translocase TatA/TatE family subunit n=1 Tax=Anaerotardibacter muris TaxID=2941505 RepID=UPI00203EDB0C|nr:twin-arginine translocase TatA/TatE family subunit [Anaerotardibacter muris]